MGIEELRSSMQQYFCEQKNMMQKRGKEYAEDGLEWESELEMSKLDVYDVFETMLEACALKAKMNPKYEGQDRTKAFAQEYLMTFITKPAEWRIDYSLAKEHRERREMELGQVRLDTVQEIRDQFRKILQENGKKG